MCSYIQFPTKGSMLPSGVCRKLDSLEPIVSLLLLGAHPATRPPCFQQDFCREWWQLLLILSQQLWNKCDS